jgi:AICAR transformylase/IMP cyclohydrolase PurH
LIEEVDIGGPTLVRAAAKNAPDVLVLTDPAQYASVIKELAQKGSISQSLSFACAARAWERVAEYFIRRSSGLSGVSTVLTLRNLRWLRLPRSFARRDTQ